MTNPTPKLYVLYARASSNVNDSITAQFRNCRDLVARERLPWREVRAYYDVATGVQDISKCPGLQQLINDVSSGDLGIDVLIVESIERLTRTDASLQLCRALVEHGVMIITADGHVIAPTIPNELDSLIGE